jgi:P27 family predicted phage terminase small subunit
MGQMSNPRKPIELKRIEGTDQPCRRGPKIKGQRDVPRMPYGLADEAVPYWRRLAPMLAKRGVLVDSDIPALEALDRADLARETIASEGMTSTSTLTGVMHIHPLVKIEIEARRQFASMWEALGLRWDPSIDAKIGW